MSGGVGGGGATPPPTPIPGDLCRPSGPDGKGQAEGQARMRAVNLSLLLCVPHGRVQVEVRAAPDPGSRGSHGAEGSK